MSIVEVAKVAGVSTATVSRVLNDLPGVRDETVQQVLAAVAALKYSPLRTRRVRKPTSTLVTRTIPRTGNIAAITLGQARDWLQLPVMASVISGVQRAAAQYGYRLMLDEQRDPKHLTGLVQNRQIDGAVVFVSGAMATSSYEPVLSSIRKHIPVVWAMGMGVTGAAGVDHVAPDNVTIGLIAHDYLRSEGRGHLAYISANPGWSFMRLRGQSFLNAATDSGRPAMAYIATTNPLLAESYGTQVVAAATLEELVVAMARATPRPDGIFVANDATTVQLYPLLARHGFRVGEDVTIVSCDQEEVRLSALHPRPASIDIGAEEIGFQSVVRLRGRMQSPADLPLLIQVRPTLTLPSYPPAEGLAVLTDGSEDN